MPAMPALRRMLSHYIPFGKDCSWQNIALIKSGCFSAFSFAESLGTGQVFSAFEDRWWPSVSPLFDFHQGMGKMLYLVPGHTTLYNATSHTSCLFSPLLAVCFVRYFGDYRDTTVGNLSSLQTMKINLQSADVSHDGLMVYPANSIWLSSARWLPGQVEQTLASIFFPFTIVFPIFFRKQLVGSARGAGYSGSDWSCLLPSTWWGLQGELSCPNGRHGSTWWKFFWNFPWHSKLF